MTALTVDSFRSSFPEFTEELYPGPSAEIRLALADKFFSEDVWTDEALRNHVMGLYAAHFLKAQGSGAAGGSGNSGEASGVVSSKSVDGASVSFDTGSVTETGAGSWNVTAYGRELYMLLKIFGAGARQI